MAHMLLLHRCWSSTIHATSGVHSAGAAPGRDSMWFQNFCVISRSSSHHPRSVDVSCDDVEHTDM